MARRPILLFVGYALGLSYGGNREGIGGPLGMVGGGYLLAAAGAVAAASRAAQPAAPARAAPPA